MNRRKKFIMISLLLIFLIFLSSCGGIKNLFKQKQDPGSMAREQESPQAENGIKKEADANSPETESRGTDQDSRGDAMEALGKNEQQLFYCEEINDDIKARIVGKSYGENCDIPFEELRYVKVLHWGFDEETHTGELIVNKSIAQDIIAIFRELYDQKYPIERMELIDEYDADDNLSMEANNTSAFNYRVIDNGSGRLSLHSYGLAIDINPLYNPYVRVVDGKRAISPQNGEKYEDRTAECPYYIHMEDPCYQAFTKRGFSWGGEWKNSKDYQHFQKTLP